VEQQKTQHPSGTGGSGAWRDQLSGATPDELAASLEQLRLRVVNRRRERAFGRSLPGSAHASRVR
jgi:hypothetical protein